MNESLVAYSSRERFALRTRRNGVIFGGLFIIGVFLIGLVTAHYFHPLYVPMVLADLAFGVGLYFLWDGANRRPIKLKCSQCDVVILSNTPWICGDCRDPVKDPSKNQFVAACHCGYEPPSYQCHKCNSIIFLGPEQEKGKPARLYIKRQPPAESPNSKPEAITTDASEIAARKHKLALAELDAKIRKADSDIVPTEKGSPEDKERSKIERYSGKRLAFQNAMSNHRAEIRRKWKNDKHKMAQELSVADEYEQIRFAEITQEMNDEK